MNYMDMVFDAIEVSKKAGSILREGFYRILEKGIEYELKGYADPVTEYDKKSESIIVNELQKLYPESSFLAEEMGKFLLNLLLGG